MVAVRQPQPHPEVQTQPAKVIIMAERRKVYSRQRVKVLLEAEQLISQAEQHVGRHKTSRVIKFRDRSCLSIGTHQAKFTYQFFAQGPGQKTNPEVLTRNETQEFLAIRRDLLE